MSARPAIRRRPARPAVLLLPVALAFAGCASVSSYQKAEAQYDRQIQQNQQLARQYSREIDTLKARQAAYQRALADEAQLNSQNAALRQRIAALQGATGSRPAAPSTAPNTALNELGQSISADAYGRLQKELSDCAALEELYERQIRSLSSRQAGSPEYQKEAGLARARALLDVVAEALLTADVARDAQVASLPAGDSHLGDALAALGAAQDRMIVALNDFKLSARSLSDSSAARALAAYKELQAAIADATGCLGQTPAEKVLARQLSALREITDAAGVFLIAGTSLQVSSLSLRGQWMLTLPLKNREPIARTISALVAAPGSGAATGPMTESEIRRLNRMEWIMTMAAYCQGDSFKPETYLQLRLDEVRPLKAAVLEIVAAYEGSHRGTVGPKDVDSSVLAKEPPAGADQPYLNSFD